MSRAEEYRRRATECVHDKQHWLRLAEHWLKLAEATEPEEEDD
jgi:hypothetical protein